MDTVKSSSAGGKAFIAGIFLLAVAASATSLWYLSRQSQRSLAWWGPEAAEHILHAPRVTLLRLSEPLDLSAAESRDISQAPGLTNVRRGLVLDGSFDWQANLSAAPPAWQYALRFDDDKNTTDKGTTTVLLSFADPPQARLAGGDRSVSIRPVAAGLHKFCGDLFVPPAGRDQ